MSTKHVPNRLAAPVVVTVAEAAAGAVVAVVVAEVAAGAVPVAVVAAAGVVDPAGKHLINQAVPDSP